MSATVVDNWDTRRQRTSNETLLNNHLPTFAMACGSASSGLVNRNGPGSAATSIIDSIVKPAEATGGKTKCIECDGYECCCIPIPCTVM